MGVRAVPRLPAAAEGRAGYLRPGAGLVVARRRRTGGCPRRTSEGFVCAHRAHLGQRCRGMAYQQHISQPSHSRARRKDIPKPCHPTRIPPTDLPHGPRDYVGYWTNHWRTVPIQSPCQGVPVESYRRSVLPPASQHARLLYSCFRLHRGGTDGPRLPLWVRPAVD